MRTLHAASALYMPHALFGCRSIRSLNAQSPTQSRVCTNAGEDTGWIDRQLKSKDAHTRTPLLRKEGEFIFWVVDREIWGVRAWIANRG
jgi:hypothetical protein